MHQSSFVEVSSSFCHLYHHIEHCPGANLTIINLLLYNMFLLI